MNIQSIVITNSIGIFLSLIVLYSSRMARRGKDPDSRLLTILLVTVCVSCVMELVSYLVDGQPSPLCGFLVWFTNTCLYLANPFAATMWLLYTDYHLHRKEKRLTTTYRPHLILLVACWIVILGNLVGHYFFTVDSANVYARRPASYTMYGVTLIMIVCSIAEVIRYRRCHQEIIFFPAWTFLVPVFIGMMVQTLYYGVSMAWCCSAIGLAALYMNMQNELAFRDALTGLYNRHYLDHILRSWKGRSGIMIDMDYFKEINDRFGHSMGDQALKDTAGILRDAAPDGSIAVRFAGDEFILLLTTRQEILIQNTENRIRKGVEERNGTGDRPYTISLSMGHAIFEQKDEDSFLEAIDKAMYVEKRARHASGTLKERRHGPEPEGGLPETPGDGGEA